MGLIARRSSALRLLIVDADADSRRIVRTSLESRITRPLMIMETAEVETARAMTGDRSFDVLILDIETLGGVKEFASFVARMPTATVYASGPSIDVAAAVASIKAGAADYVEKPIDGTGFARRIERQFIDTDRFGGDRFEGLVGRSEPMRHLFAQIDRLAHAPAPVFILGETGTGKSLVARALHDRSRRRNAGFVTVECAGQDSQSLQDLLCSDGGALDRAAGGTLYFDEVADLPDATQGLLLRILDGGDVGQRKITARIIASSNRTLDQLTGPAGLRPDLYFRLNVLPLVVPPLRDREEDFPLLLDDLTRQGKRVMSGRGKQWSAEAEALLSARDWLGNIRELKSLVDRAVASCPSDQIGVEHVQEYLPPRRVQPAPARPVTILPLWMEEERIIEAAIDAFDGNIAKAAAALEISPSTIYRKRRPESGDQLRIA